MNVRAKFLCNRKSEVQNTPTNTFDFEFSAVTSGSKENEEFWKWTPSGQIKVSVVREDLFEVGKSYYLDFTLAE